MGDLERWWNWQKEGKYKKPWGGSISEISENLQSWVSLKQDKWELKEQEMKSEYRESEGKALGAKIRSLILRDEKPQDCRQTTGPLVVLGNYPLFYSLSFF